MIGRYFETFQHGKELGDPQSPFLGTGVMINGKVWTSKTAPREAESPVTLGDVLQNPEEVMDDFILTPRASSKSGDGYI